MDSDGMPGDPEGSEQRHRGTRVARSGALLLAGTLAANVLSYVFFVILSRHLSQGSLGAVGTMVNLSAIAGVPALGLQLVAAREVARARHRDTTRGGAELDARIIRLGLELGLLAAVLVAVLSPLLGHLFQVDLATLLLLALSMVPLGVTFSVQGILQGEEKFGALAAVLATSGVSKLAAALVAATLGGDVLVVVACLTGGWLVTAAFGLAMLPQDRRRPDRRHPSRLRRMVAAAVVPTSGLLVLSSLDVLLARHHLSPADSGAYTVGALFEKAAFWGMAFIATLFYPGMARPGERGRATSRALGVTVGVGLLGVLVTAAMPGPLAVAAGGSTYAALAPVLWRFTLLGVLLAVVQVLVFSGLAGSRTRAGVVVWLGASGAVVAAQVVHDSVTDIVTVMLVVSAGLVAVGGVIEARHGGLLPRRQ